MILQMQLLIQINLCMQTNQYMHIHKSVRNVPVGTIETSTVLSDCSKEQ